MPSRRPTSRKYRTLPVDKVNLYDPAQYGFRGRLPAVNETVIVLPFGETLGSVRQVLPERRRVVVALLDHGYHELDLGAVRPLPNRKGYQPTGRPRGRPRSRPQEPAPPAARPAGRPRGRHSSAEVRMMGVRLKQEAREMLRAACRRHRTDAASVFEALIDRWYAEGCPPLGQGAASGDDGGLDRRG